MEVNEDLTKEVQEKKCRIDECNIPYYKETYKLTSIQIIGLLVGARGTMLSQFAQFCKKNLASQTN